MVKEFLLSTIYIHIRGSTTSYDSIQREWMNLIDCLLSYQTSIPFESFKLIDFLRKRLIDTDRQDDQMYIALLKTRKYPFFSAMIFSQRKCLNSINIIELYKPIRTSYLQQINFSQSSRCFCLIFPIKDDYQRELDQLYNLIFPIQKI